MGKGIHDIFSDETLTELFPENRSNSFFDALYGDATEGAYDIQLKFVGGSDEQLNFEFQLHQRPGKCLACNLTYGLPQVFTRHPIINITGLVEKIGGLLQEGPDCLEWQIGRTMEKSRELHTIPLTIKRT